ncbi:U-reduvitoxin-Pr11a [Hyalella azteca]|uniref:U-reduvitoxin-Pr11a n=1 Tax=Hyalella azteca TaxID=294128 RepID=A0A8B7NH02_HYAAZ|nr:U-reduvitoxin-Pr11a [Hyalella azteca]
MRFLLALLGLSVLAFFVASADYDRYVDCKDGSVWYDGCNTCFCYNRIAACTKKACPPGRCGKPLCKNGSKWKAVGADWCTCVNKKPKCTKKPCQLGG